MGGGGGGERGGPSLGKRAAVIIEQGTIMKTLQIFKVYHILLTRIVDPGRHQENISAGIEQGEISGRFLNLCDQESALRPSSPRSF